MEHVFTGCSIQAVDMPFPDGSVGKCIVISENRPGGGDTYRFPFPEGDAKNLAKQLTTSVHIASPDQVDSILGRNGRKMN